MKRKYHRSARRSQRGVTMVEAALVSIMFVALIGVFTDLGLNLYRYSRLNSAAVQTIRKFALGLSGSDRACTEIQGEMSAYAEKQLPATGGRLTVSPVIGQNATGLSTVRLTATWNVGCFFCIWTWGQRLQVQAESTVEARDFVCL